ncbi:hypothetical protein HWV62_16222 [Athelia sp. TMB]|nr:hypothetical protein HWV62_16222 [Athelia sp. TMB]
MQSSERFCAADADIVFLSSDSILFRVHSSNLTCGSEGFAPPTGTSSLSKHDIVQLTETSMTLELLFQFMYPQRPPDLSALEFKSFMGVAEAAEKYQVYSAMQICAMQMESCYQDHPFEVMTYAIKHGYKRLMDVSERRALGLSPPEALGLFSTDWYIAWWVDVLHFALTYKKVETMPNHWDHAWRIAEILRLLGEGPASLCDLDRVFQPMDWGLGGCDECKLQTWQSDVYLDCWCHFDSTMADVYDILIITDATTSMGEYLNALKTSIPEILGLAQLSGVFRRLGVLAYRDYTEPENERIVWSGWNPDDILGFVNRLEPDGGGDFPEAAKTALIRGLQAVDKDARTLILWYTDAPPHHCSVNSYENDLKEAAAFPAGATDWVKLCRIAAKRHCTVFSFTPKSLASQFSCFYTLLSELTGGISISTSILSSSLISRLTLDIILQWMGQAPAIEGSLITSGATLCRYESSPLTIASKLSNELEGSRGYLPASLKDSSLTCMIRICETPLESSNIPNGLSFSASSMNNLAKRFATPSEEAFRTRAYASLSVIIDSNVASLTYNPIFGHLWRAVCKDTNNVAEKNKLINSFSVAVCKIADPEVKRNLALWLEESFDATEEIQKIVGCAPAGGPQIYLDLDSGVDLTRTELLEVSRSCYSGILKKLASIFTHLKLLEPESKIQLAPGHLTIPLTLSPVQLFRILPHLVVPGTMYATRAASLTAILALSTGVLFLRGPAEALLTPIKGTWLNLDVPENISWDCAKLLLSAPKGMILNSEERRVFIAMRRYKNVEMNMEADIKIRLGWTPKKRRNVGDRRERCQRCHVRRSVTIMSGEHKGVCGCCIYAISVKKDPLAWTLEKNFTNEDELLGRVFHEDMSRTLCEDRIVTTKALVAENGLDWLGLKPLQGVLEGKSAFKLMSMHGASAFGSSPNASGKEKAAFALRYHGKTLHNSQGVLSQVEGRAEDGLVDLGTCSLCYDDVRRDKLIKACGRTGCQQTVDEKCLQEWYGKSAPGQLLSPTQLCCPFCRRLPAVKILSRFNRLAVTLCGLQTALTDTHFFYGWCTDCGYAKRAYERACCGEDRVGELHDWKCVECADAHDALIRRVDRELNPLRTPRQKAKHKDEELVDATYKRCPRCSVPIEKIYGCNHITCICGQHFCYVCGIGTSRSQIYGHIQSKHGGIYDVGPDDELAT